MSMCYTNKIKIAKNLDVLDVALTLAIRAQLLPYRTQYETKRPGSFELRTYIYNTVDDIITTDKMTTRQEPPRNGVVGYPRSDGDNSNSKAFGIGLASSWSCLIVSLSHQVKGEPILPINQSKERKR